MSICRVREQKRKLVYCAWRSVTRTGSMTLCLRERLRQARLLTGCLFAGQDSIQIVTEQRIRKGSSGTGPKTGGPYYLHTASQWNEHAASIPQQWAALAVCCGCCLRIRLRWL